MGKVTPLSENPLPLTVACVIFAVVPPELVIAAANCLLLPSVTVPKFRLVGLVVNWGAVEFDPEPFDPEELLDALTPAHPVIRARTSMMATDWHKSEIRWPWGPRLAMR